MGRRVAVKGTLGVSHINENRKKKCYGKYLKSISPNHPTGLAYLQEGTDRCTSLGYTQGYLKTC